MTKRRQLFHKLFEFAFEPEDLELRLSKEENAYTPFTTGGREKENQTQVFSDDDVPLWFVRAEFVPENPVEKKEPITLIVACADPEAKMIRGKALHFAKLYLTCGVTYTSSPSSQGETKKKNLYAAARTWRLRGEID